MPNWMSYGGEGCSLSFHIPPVFQGLVVWFVYPLEKDFHNLFLGYFSIYIFSFFFKKITKKI